MEDKPNKIIDYLIDHKERFKEETKKYTEAKEIAKSNTHILFNDDIDVNYRDIVKMVIVNDVTKTLAYSYEDVIIVLEEMNLEDYLS